MITLCLLVLNNNATTVHNFIESSIDMSTFKLEETNELPVIFLSHAAPVLIMKESMFSRHFALSIIIIIWIVS
jgi:hypothetical protein